MMKVHLTALGCRLNEAELENWSRQFLGHGFTLSASAEDADLVVLNTCAVTGEASRKSRNLINRLHRHNPNARLVVTGCHSSLNPEATADTLGVDLVIPNEQKQTLADITIRQLGLDNTGQMGQPDDIALYARGRHRAFIKIQDGCRYRCTFCIVTVARGEERSIPEREVIDTINHYASHGIQEAVLTGVHVGGYGSDIGSSLFRLVQRILVETDIPRLRFASVEPWDLPDDFFSLFQDARLMPHMHLPLQSGSDSVLRRMARRCKTAEFRMLIDKARTQVERFNVTTDIIAGFPGETEQEWQQTLKFVESIGFGHIHIFPYSPREGTKAARLPDQIDKATRQRRCRELAMLAEQLKHQAMQKELGSNQAVLWESPQQRSDGTVEIQGYTPGFHRVRTLQPEGMALEYQVTDTHLTGISTHPPLLEGVILDPNTDD